MQDPLAVSYKGQEGSGLAQVLPKSSFDVSEASKEMFEKTFTFELKKQQENKAKAAKLLDDLQIKMKDMQAKKKLEVLQKKRNFETKYQDVLAKYDNMNTPIPDKIILELEQEKTDIQSDIDTANQDYKDYGDFVSKVGTMKDVDPEATFANLQKAWNENNELDRSKLSFVFTEDPLGFINKQVITPLKEQTGQTVSVSDANGGIIETKVKQPLKSKQEILDDGREKLKTNQYLYNKYGTSEEGLNAWDNLVLSSIPKEITRDYQRNPQTQDDLGPLAFNGVPSTYKPSDGGKAYRVATGNSVAVKQKPMILNNADIIDEQGNSGDPSTSSKVIVTGAMDEYYYNGDKEVTFPLKPEDGGLGDIGPGYIGKGKLQMYYTYKPGQPLNGELKGDYSEYLGDNIGVTHKVAGWKEGAYGSMTPFTGVINKVGGTVQTNLPKKDRGSLKPPSKKDNPIKLSGSESSNSLVVGQLYNLDGDIVQWDGKNLIKQ